MHTLSHVNVQDSVNKFKKKKSHRTTAHSSTTQQNTETQLNTVCLRGSGFIADSALVTAHPEWVLTCVRLNNTCQMCIRSHRVTNARE